MGYDKNKRPLGVPGTQITQTGVGTTVLGDHQIDWTFTAATNGVRFGRIVRVKTDGTIIPTTGSSGRMGIGVTLSSGASGASVRVRIGGVVDVCPTTPAIAKGIWVRGASGPSTGTSAGLAAASSGILASALGFTLTSAAAGATSTGRTVKIKITHTGHHLG